MDGRTVKQLDERKVLLDLFGDKMVECCSAPPVKLGPKGGPCSPSSISLSQFLATGYYVANFKLHSQYVSR